MSDSHEPRRTRRPDFWFVIGTLASTIAYHLYQTGAPIELVVLLGAVGTLAIARGLHLWVRRRAGHDGVEDAGSGPAVPDSKPIEPHEGVGLRTFLLLAVLLLILIVDVAPVRSLVLDALPYRIELAGRFPAPPLRGGEWVLVANDTSPPAVGQVAWLETGRGSTLPALVTVLALGPDTTWAEVAIATELRDRVMTEEREDALGRRRTVLPAGTLRVRYRDPTIGEEAWQAVCPLGWSRGIGTRVFLPIDRARRLP